MNDDRGPDARKEYVVQCILAILNIQRSNFRSNAASNEALDRFLDDADERVLQAVETEKSADDGKTTVLLATSFTEYKHDSNECHFVKIAYEPLTTDNLLQNIMISSLRRNPLRSLSTELQEVYVPMLLEKKTQISKIAWGEMMEGRLADCLLELDAGLKVTICRGMSIPLGSNVDESDVTGILSPIDEVRYWQDLSTNGKTPSNAERAQQFYNRLAPIIPDLEAMDTKTFPELIDMMSPLLGALDTLWQIDDVPVYPQRRMEHFMHTMAISLGRIVAKRLTNEQVWTLAFSQVGKQLREALKMTERWAELCAEWTGQDWKTCSHMWEGEPFRDTYLTKLGKRLYHILDLRAQHDQILRLLSPDELQAFSLDKVFDSFKKIYALTYNNYTVPQWENALSEYEKFMEPLEGKVADRLRVELGYKSEEIEGGGANPTQSMRVFLRFSNLLERKNIRASLNNERERLLAEIMDYLNRVQYEFENSKPVPGRSFSKYADRIIWLEQLRAKTEACTRPLLGFLKDLGSSRTLQTAKHLRQELKTQKNRLFEEWQENVEDLLSQDASNPEFLELNGKVMDFDVQNKGALKIIYPERLVALIKETRMFAQMGLQIPKRIQRAVEKGMMFYRFAVQLKQVCNLYNNMAEEILPFQKPMVLQSAMRFEKLFSEKEGLKRMVWDRVQQVEEFTTKVKNGAEKLRQINRQLSTTHDQILQQVLGLATVSLLRQRELWKTKVGDISKMIDDAVQLAGCESDEASQWRTHWDFQIAKVMEAQYRYGLESLNETLPLIKCELAKSNRQLRVRPQLEDLRTAYFKEIKSFVQLPFVFKGLQGTNNVFRVIPERCRDGVITVFKKSEQLFMEVEALTNSLSHWLSVGFMMERMQELADKLTHVSQWEFNFRALKQKRKEMEKIPDSFKIDCISVSTVIFKSTVENYIDLLTSSLIIALRRRVQEDVKTIFEFLTDSLEKLNVRPNSVRELGKAQTDAVALMEKQDEIQQQINACEEKNKMLRLPMSQPVETAELMIKWEEFQVRLQTFETLAKDLRQELKGKMDDRDNNLLLEVEKFTSRWKTLKPEAAQNCTLEEARNNARKMKEWKEEWDNLNNQIDSLKVDCEDFGLGEPKAADAFIAVSEDIAKQEQSWSLFEAFSVEITEMSSASWLDFRPTLFRLGDFIQSWDKRVQDLPPDPVTRLLAEQISKLNLAYPVLKNMTGETYEKEHWRALFSLLELKDVAVATITLQHFVQKLELLLQNATQIKELAIRALGEVTIREAMTEIGTWLDMTSFTFVNHVAADGQTLAIIKEWKDVMNAVNDNICMFTSLKDSKYFAPFRDQADMYELKLNTLDSILLIMNKVQRKWLYLDPIFSRGALPKEKDRFDRAAREYRQHMRNIHSSKKVQYVCTVRGLMDQFQSLSDQFDRCQKALNKFLEEKRQIFPRLYFVGDEDLLEILGQSSNPQVIQQHLKKLFAGIYRVELLEDKTEIIAIKSALNEYVELLKPIKVIEDGEPRPVEIWLQDLADQMVLTLTEKTKNCLDDGDMDFTKFPSQILNLCSSIIFVNKVENALGVQGQVHNIKKQLQNQLGALTSMDDQDPLKQAKLKALILDHIHQITVCDLLVENKVQKAKDWSWYKQLRYYTIGPTGCSAMILECVQQYSYEYQGNAAKLVHTPLTDKCYLAMLHGMHLGYGGNPYGPAGTGKTESVKALGGALGRQVLVFNCDEGIDYEAMGRIFIGLVRCGAWGCFDEFNRLLEEQMSAISQLIQIIQAAIKHRQNSIVLLGRDVEVNFYAGIFITMNPAVKGYGGRQKLPDNLKQLFRPVAMSVPDAEIIAEVLLFSEGFTSAKTLSKKTVALFLLSKQLLSYQQHYDWGLRALKTILIPAGRACQEAKSAAENKHLTEKQEGEILLRVVRMNTMSKLTYSDARRFNDLCQDLFPDFDVQDVEYPELEKDIREALEEMKLNVIESQITKILQFYEATKQRMGVGIVGPSGCGKSVIWKVLSQVFKRRQVEVKIHQMNPKSMPRNQLLGYMDPDTREWFDGVLTASARDVIKQDASTISWVVCDGDVDPEWVESLNSVLDDNRLMTLPNGERIQFQAGVNFIFETDHLTFASPATVTRIGMIFLSERDVDIERIIKTWILEKPLEMQNKLETWFNDFFHVSLKTVYGKKTFSVDTTAMGMVRNVLGHMVVKKDPETGTFNDISKAEFMLAVCRGLGGNLGTDDRQDLYRQVAQIFDEILPNPTDPTDVQIGYSGNLEVITPLSGSEITVEKLRSGNLPLVPTKSSTCFLKFFDTWLEEGLPFIVCGPPGCGKTQLILDGIQRFKEKIGVSLNVAVIHCNAQTSSKQLLLKLKQYCNSSTGVQGRAYRPKDVRRLVILLKDINLPRPDKYNTSQIISLLQQLVMYNGFYDDDLEYARLENVQIVASMASADTFGRHHVSTRFTSNMRLCSITEPSKKELVEIYTTYLDAVLPRDRNRDIAKMVEGMVDIYAAMRNRFSLDDHAHYLFCPRDLTRWVLQLLSYETSSPDELIDAWAFTACRIFRDRLVGEDVNEFDAILTSDCCNLFGRMIDTQKIFYTSLLSRDPSTGVPTGMLQQVSPADYLRMVQDGMKRYQREVRELDVEIFDQVLHQMCRVERVISAVDVNDLLLVGRQGVGRRSTLTLMAHMMNLHVYSPSLSMKYGWKEWTKDLKQVVQMTGIDNENTILFLEDHHIQPQFLEVINSLLSAGEIPGLFSSEELEPMMHKVKTDMQDSGIEDQCSPFEYFVNQVRNNLRIVLSMDPTHPHFLPCCAANPALFNCCNVLWLNDWTRENQKIVAKKQLKDLKVDWAVDLVLTIYGTQLQFGATLRHLVSMLEVCHHIYSSKAQEQSGRKTHLSKGLEKLLEVHEKVDVMQRTASQKQEDLKVKQTLAQESLTKIREAMSKAAERKNEVQQLSKKAADDEAANRVEKETIEFELSGIQPILDAARKAVGSIKPDHLNEIRSLKMPPDPIADVLSGVLRLMGNYDASWGSMRKFLAGTGVIQRILNFDMRTISPEIRKEVEKLLRDKANSFDHNVIYRVSVAAAPLAKWVSATVKYSQVLEKILPMEKKLASANQILQETQTRLDQCRQELALIDDQVQEIQEEFNVRTREAEAFRMDILRANEILVKARNLMDKLSGEKDRWEYQTNDIQRHTDQLPAFSVMAAGYISYLGYFGEDVRKDQRDIWMAQYSDNSNATGVKNGNTESSDFNFIKFLATESECLKLKSEGLPSDEVSQENALVITTSLLVPFIVDPNSQAVEWLRRHLSSPETCLQQDSKFQQNIELALRFGKVLVVQEMDGIPAMMFPCLRKDLVRQGPRLVVQIGEKQCDYNSNFSLYLCSRNSSALESVPPNALCLLTRVNFSVTRAGLEGQLLGITLAHEKPDLEKRKSELLHQEEEFKMQLTECEDKLLVELADSTGDVLQNTSLIKSLEDIKSKALTIQEALDESNKLQASLDDQREVFRGLAKLGSNLFILLRDLVALDEMYRFALNSFTKLFKKVLQRKTGADTIEEKLNYLGNALKIEVLFFVSRSLFKKDRLTFGMHHVRHIMPELFGPNEREFFQGIYVPTTEASGEIPSWVPQTRQAAVRQLLSVSNIEALKSNDIAWDQWMQSDKCEESFDSSIYQHTTAFQRLLIVQALRPDRLETAMNQFAVQVLGVSSLSPPPLSLVRLHDDEMTCYEPVLFVTTPGADPSLELEEFAKTHKDIKFHQLAMGGGNQDLAIQLLRQAAPKGDWICLKNLHLVMSWVPILEKEIKTLEPADSFRCWLTTEPHQRFPSILLESALKVTYEAPPGIKKNLLRTFESWTPDWFSKGSKMRSQVIFLCAHFHAIMQERRTYIPLGWSKFYEFSQGDLASACETVDILVRGEAVDWVTLVGVLDNAVYGSRVDNDFDLRVVREYLSAFFRPDTLLDAKNSSTGCGIIELPKGTTVMADFRSKVEQLPDAENPRSFGMAPNVDRSLQRTNSNIVISNLRHLTTHAAFSVGTAGGVDVKLWKEHLQPLWKFWDHWLKTQFKTIAKITVREVDPEDMPVTAFVLMDVLAASDLCEIVSNTLENLKRVCTGSCLSTPDLLAVAHCLMSSKVPDDWTNSWQSAPVEPMVFLRGLSRRAFKLKSEWIPRVDKQVLFDAPVSLNDFLRPDVFLNALRQQSARKLRASVESLCLVSTFGSFSELGERVNEVTVQIQGLLLEGCTFDETQSIFVESKRTSDLVSTLPILSIAWFTTASAQTAGKEHYQMARFPMYASMSREHLLIDIQVYSDSSRARVFNSAAIFLNDYS